MNIYLDNAATTKIDSGVLKEMARIYRLATGNASSLHKPGVLAAFEIEKARKIISEKLEASPEEIVFTGSGTEANNLALKGSFQIPRKKKNHIIISAIEHPSILETCNWLKMAGASINYLPVSEYGLVNPETVKNALTSETLMVSVMHANNEIGTLQPIREIGKICRDAGIIFHTDACQSFGKISLSSKKDYFDLLTMNAHKLHGPRGVGALFVRKGIFLDPILHGGGQENGLRSGTSNTEAIVGFGKAVEVFLKSDYEKIESHCNYLLKELKRDFSNCFINGSEIKRLASILNLALIGIDAKTVYRKLNKKNIFVSTGSACFSGKSQPSHVLTAMGKDNRTAGESLRISLSKFTTKREIDLFLTALKEIFDEKG